jgi:hypothetical protein
MSREEKKKPTGSNESNNGDQQVGEYVGRVCQGGKRQGFTQIRETTLFGEF